MRVHLRERVRATRDKRGNTCASTCGTTCGTTYVGRQEISTWHSDQPQPRPCNAPVLHLCQLHTRSMRACRVLTHGRPSSVYMCVEYQLTRTHANIRDGPGNVYTCAMCTCSCAHACEPVAHANMLMCTCCACVTSAQMHREMHRQIDRQIDQLAHAYDRQEHE